MTIPRRQMIEFIEQEIIPPDKIEDALKTTGIIPDAALWRSFIDGLLLWTGGLALAFSMLFFVAYNWKNMGHFAKFGMVEVFLILTIAVYYKWHDTVAGRVSLLVATLSLGVLLALYGQVFQTGADTWQLFFNWSVMMLPWAVIACFPGIWILWVTLINMSIIMYSLTFWRIFGFVFNSESGILWMLFFFNTLALVAWQLLATKWSWLRERWAIRFLAVGSGAPLSWLVMYSIFTHRGEEIVTMLTWGLWLGVMYVVYRRVKPDLFMLAGCCLSAIAITVSLFGEHVIQWGDAGDFLILAMIVIVMGGGAALWLKHIHQEVQS